MPQRLAPFHVLAKPIGPACNLACSYCYYLDKRRLFGGGERLVMSEDVLEAFVRQYIEAQDCPEIEFAWQGGEPTLLGLAFFERAIELQRRYAGGRRIRNALQTNGTMLDEDWCRFLRRNGFLVGISLDGPRELHDAYRTDARGRPTWERAMAGLALLKKHGVEFNTLTVVHRANAAHPLAVYRFLRDCGSRFIQFIPLVERRVTQESRDAPQGVEMRFAAPPLAGPSDDCLEPEAVQAAVSPETVRPGEWGAFLCAIFDRWVRRDVGRVFVQQFDVALGQWLGAGSALCVFAETCGRALALEHDGGLYACDHYVFPRWRLGNLRETPLAELVELPRQREFGAAKAEALCARCRDCAVKFACQGDCPRHRFVRNGAGAVSYLCAGYRLFFEHVAAPMARMAELARAGRPAADIMRSGHAADRPVRSGRGSERNAPCPCGSGRKFKHCCGAHRTAE
ncbi:MAG: anaerobic sulfatase maturase [Burkholderiales bacterium]|nr:anaerobic sulfatase maturase [Burkholderiales bacterium]